MRFGFVPPPVPKHIWDEAEAVLDVAAERGGVDLSDLRGDVFSGLAQLWVARGERLRSACVTCIQDGDCTIWLMGGDIADLQWLPIIEDAARERGCKRMWLHGRKGWARVLKDYSVASVGGKEAVLEKCL